MAGTIAATILIRDLLPALGLDYDLAYFPALMPAWIMAFPSLTAMASMINDSNFPSATNLFKLWKGRTMPNQMILAAG
jgi:hypothetical protein